MSESDPAALRLLIDRVSRLALADDWADGLNPSQRAALAYLGRANRFSRAPSHVAAYLGATRGTVSQTLHVLERKGLVTAVQSATDKRTISYNLTAAGHAEIAREVAFNAAVGALSQTDAKSLQDGLSQLLKVALAQNDGRSFGMCHTCTHHRVERAGRRCALLDVMLTEAEAQALCHEHVAAAG